MKGSKDNMTACVIKFPKQIICKGGEVLAQREHRGAEVSTSNGGNDNVDEQRKVQLLRRVFNPYVEGCWELDGGITSLYSEGGGGPA